MPNRNMSTNTDDGSLSVAFHQHGDNPGQVTVSFRADVAEYERLAKIVDDGGAFAPIKKA